MRNSTDVVKFNALLEALVIVTKLFKRPFTAEALVYGLPVEDGKNTPQLFTIDKAKSQFSRAAARAGISSSLVRKDIQEISNLVLPTILLLKNNGACILLGFNHDKTQAEVILPEFGESKQWLNVEDINDEYLGYAFYVKKESLEDKRDNQEKTVIKHRGHWFWGTVKFSANIYRDALIASFLINIFVLATPLFTMNVYDRVVPNVALDTLWVLSIGVIIIFIFDTILKFIRAYFLEVASKKNNVIMSSILFEKVMDLKMDSYPKSIGSFANHIKEFSSLSSFFASATLSTIIDLPFVFIFLFVIYFIAGSIVFVPIITIILILSYTYTVKKYLKKSIESSYDANAKKYGILIESLTNLETLKTLGSIGQAQYKWEESSGDIAQKNIKTKILSNSILTVTSLFIQINVVSILIVGVYMISTNDLTIGGLIATVILASRAIAPMGQVAGLLSNYEHVKTTYQVLEKIMKIPVEHPEGKKFLNSTNITGKIEFKNVSFKYKGEDINALENISFTINPGEKVAIIGKIGSGKTTIEKLLLGLYSPSDGSILYDNIELSQMDPVNIRKSINYVAQDTKLFKGTVRGNIVASSQDATDAQILQASEISGVTSFVFKHPKGFDMEIGEGGNGLSGGQIQSVALARALVSDAPIYLFDEPTNSMDGNEEIRLIRHLKEKLNDKTLIVITHKPAVLDLVDRIIVVNDGKILLDDKKTVVLQKLAGK